VSEWKARIDAPLPTHDRTRHASRTRSVSAEQTQLEKPNSFDASDDGAIRAPHAPRPSGVLPKRTQPKKPNHISATDSAARQRPNSTDVGLGRT
jgi:hypothetical protein